jgi:PAS domain S-box-containing protein
MPSEQMGAQPESPNPVPAREIRYSLLLLVTAAILVAGYLYYRSEIVRIRLEQSRVISGIGELKSGQVEQWRFERIADAQVAVLDPILLNAVALYQREPFSSEPRQALAASLAARAKAYRYLEARLTFIDGSTLSSIDSLTTSRNDTTTGAAMAEVLAGGDARLSEFFATGSGTVRVDAVAALRDAAGKAIGVLVLRCDPDRFLNPMIRFWPGESRTAAAWLVERQGDEVAIIGGESEYQGRPLSFWKGPPAKAPAAVRASLERAGAFDGADADGNRVLADLRSIPHSEWRMVSQIEADEIMASGRFRLRAIALIVASVVLLTFVTFSLLHRRRQAVLFEERYLAERRGREAHQALRESEAKFREVLESMNLAAIVLDGKGRVTLCSDYLLELTGWARPEVIGHDWFERFLPQEIRSEIQSVFARFFTGDAPKRYENEIVTRKGRRILIGWSNSTLRDDKGAAIGVVSIGEDITARKQAQDDLQKLNAELERRVQERTAQLASKNKELETFSYSVSHDLKAPLRGIDGYSKILLDEYSEKIDGEGREFLRNIRSGADQMRQLIEDMLAYSKLERRSLTLTPQDLRASVERVIAERRFELGEAQVVVDVAPGAISADHEGLAIVLRNLIDNAVKFSRLRRPPVIEIRSRIDGDRHILSVKDNGTGFAMKHHDLIFQIFQRLHRAEEYNGTGVGLAIVKKAMDRMEGRVWAESEPEKGAVFSIELPVA